jgi:hypothetical protein
MRTRFRRSSATIAAGVRRFLAQGRPARVAACVVVALAAVVWLGVVVVALRFVLVLAAIAAAGACAWLVASIWSGDPDWSGGTASRVRHLWARGRLALEARMPSSERGWDEFGEPEEPARASVAHDDDDEDAALTAFRRSAEVLTAELLARHERLHAGAQALQRELASQIESVRALVTRMEQLEHEVAQLADQREQPVRDSARAPAPVDDLPVDPDLRLAFEELEADLRLEKVEVREQQLLDRETRLEQRERELAAFVEATQSRLS